jgi:hypothetical protein
MQTTSWNLQLHPVLIILRGNCKEGKGSEEGYLSKYNKKLKHGEFLCFTYNSCQGWRVGFKSLKAIERQILNFTLKKAPSTAVLRSVYVDWKILNKM